MDARSSSGCNWDWILGQILSWGKWVHSLYLIMPILTDMHRLELMAPFSVGKKFPYKIAGVGGDHLELKTGLIHKD